jgi:DNA repair exonuclease SbcCD nuclease subunit
MKYEVLGDPHLGRKFETGVPLHRKGEREHMQREKFLASLMNAKAEVHVTMGDLFDKFIVPPEVVLFASHAYMRAAEDNPNTTYVVLRGNHDVSRNADKASSWDLFCALVDQHPNVWAVDEHPIEYEGMLFVPYDPFNYDHLEVHLNAGIETVFGHFDIVDFGGHNVAPTELFARYGVKTLVNGHDHVGRRLVQHGVEVIVTGSMEPFTHAEDKTGDLYVTVTLDELAKLDVRNKNVRVLLKDGETLPDDLDCLSLVAKRVIDDDADRTVDTEEFDSLDLDDMLALSLDGLTVKDSVLSFFKDLRHAS